MRSLLCATAASAFTLAQTSAFALPADVGGQWGPVFETQIVGVHEAVLPSSNQNATRVLLYDGENNNANNDPTGNVTHARLLTIPVNGQPLSITAVNYTQANLFCSGLAVTVDGLVHIGGGQIQHNDYGAPYGVAFDSLGGNAWVQRVDSLAPHWYGSGLNTTAGFLLYGGSKKPGVRNKVPELYDEGAKTWHDLTSVTVSVESYPWIFAAPNGTVAVASLPSVGFINLSGSGKWKAGPTNAVKRTRGTAADIDDQIYLVGGRTRSVQKFDLRPLQTNSAVIGSITNVTPVKVGRTDANVTILADGALLYTGGSTTGSRSDIASAEKRPELRDMKTGSWSFMNAEATPRLYHSTAVLLVDGRVLSGAGGLDQLRGATDFPNAQIFSPPYLFRGARPVIVSAPSAITYNSTFTVVVQGGTIAKVTLVGLSAVTHSFNSGQSLHTLPEVQSGTRIIVTAPSGSARVPPGYYMLFVLNDTGVPSIAQVLKLGS